MKKTLFLAFTLLLTMPGCEKKKAPAASQQGGATENVGNVNVKANDDKAQVKVEGKAGKVSVKADDDKAEVKAEGKEGKVSVKTDDDKTEVKVEGKEGTVKVKTDDDTTEVQAGGVKIKVGKDGVNVGGLKVPTGE